MAESHCRGFRSFRGQFIWALWWTN